MFCSKCGSQVADNASFCPACGQPTAAESAPPRGIPIAPGSFPPPAAPSPLPGASPAGGGPPPAYPSAGTTPSIGYAGFWLRLVAWFIDAIILWIVSTFITLPLVAESGLRNMLLNHPPQTPEELFAFMGTFSKVIVLGIVIKWLYYTRAASR